MATPKTPNSGFFGKNNRKTSERGPDLTGSVFVGDDTLQALNAAKARGEPPILYLAGWTKTPQDGGDKYVSLKCNPPMSQQGAGAGVPKATTKKDDDIPF